MYEPHITVTGNLASDPSRRTLATGTVVADFRLANRPRRFDKDRNTWGDGAATWFTVTCWRGLADNVTESLKKGDRVVVTGRLSTREYTTQAGEERANLEIDAATVGLDLTFGTAVLKRNERRADAGAEAWAVPGVAPEAVPVQATGEDVAAAA